MNNLFLTGKRNIGKTTLIEKYLTVNKHIFPKVAGFRTRELFKNNALYGFYLEDLLFDDQDYTLVGMNEAYPYGRKNKGIIEGFETRGVAILKRALESDADIIILDELGFFELEARQFKEKVYALLDSEKKVLGVLKQKNNPFLEGIKARSDVKVIDVTLENRHDLIVEMSKFWRDLNET